jgi:cell division protein FtsL
MMNRLDSIATRQRKSFARDVLFAALVVVAGAVSVSSVSVAAQAAHTTHADIARR